MKENPEEKLEVDSLGDSEAPMDKKTPPSPNLGSTLGEEGVDSPPTDSENEIVEGEIVLVAPALNEQASPSKRISPLRSSPLPVTELEGIAANGGAVGAFVLGIWTILGSFWTHWSLVNGILGLILGFWGLTSKRRRLALIGIVLCLVGVALSMISIGDIISDYLKTRQEEEF